MMIDSSLDADVLAARSGSRPAFERLVTRTRNLVTSISLATVRDVGTSEEVAQDVFLAVWCDLGSLRNPASFLPWLRQVTRRQSIRAARKGRRLGPPVDLAQIDVVDARPTAQDALLGDERALLLSESLDAIPDEAREVITLYYREGQSIEQVARLLGLRADTAKKRLSRARVALRAEVLARFAESVETSVPGDSLTSAVMMALPLAAVPAGAAAGGTGLAWLGKGATVLSSGGAGLIGGVFGVVVGVRQALAKARDDRERRDLRRLGWMAGLNVGLLALAMPVVDEMGHQAVRTIGTAWIAVFTAIHLALYMVWMPRAQARRLASERAEDPAAGERQARARRRSLAACAVVVAVMGGLVVALATR